MSALWLLALLTLAPTDAGTPLLARPVEISADKLTVLNLQQRAEYAGHARAVRDTTTVTCDTLSVFYDEKKSVQRIECAGQVQAVDGDRTARGDTAVFDNRTGVLVLRGHPEATQGSRRVTGDEITFTTGVDRVEVTAAHTVADAEETKKGGPARVEIDADRLLFDSDRRQATWSGHVKARRGTTHLVSPVLTAHYDEQGAITHVQATGGVEATDQDKWAKGQRADFDNSKGLLTVTGKPEARQGTSRMKGTKVTFVSGSDTLEVDNATTVVEVKPQPKGQKR